ncbi:MAG: phenylacetate--CoA ligase family protein [Alphaproteobacteria bacterium]
MERRILDADWELAPPERLRALQFARLQKILAKTKAMNPFYADHWRKAGVDVGSLTGIEDFSARVPMVEKADFVSDQADEPPFGRRHRHVRSLGVPLVTLTSSGTSGYGVEVHLQTNEDMANHDRMTAYFFTWAGLKKADAVMLTMHVSMLAGGRCEYHAALHYGLSVYPAAMYDTARKIEILARFRPRALLGTTSYFGHLAAVAGSRARDFGLEILLGGAEAASIAWFKKLEEQFGAKAYDRYGLAPLAADHMFTCEHGVGTREKPGILHNVESDVLLEVIDMETGKHARDGEAGEIVLTSLTRHDTPLIRCRTRDRAIWRAPKTCSCGRSFSGIEIGSVARVDDVKKVKGINIWPQAVDELLFAHDDVDEYQVLLETDSRASDIATVRIMPVRALAEAPARALADSLVQALRHKIGIGFAVDVLDPGALDRSDYKARRWVDRRAHIVSNA